MAFTYLGALAAMAYAGLLTKENMRSKAADGSRKERRYFVYRSPSHTYMPEAGAGPGPRADHQPCTQLFSLPKDYYLMSYFYLFVIC